MSTPSKDQGMRARRPTVRGQAEEPAPLRLPSLVAKRDGRSVPFDKDRIVQAVARAQAAVGESDAHFAQAVADVVALGLASRRRGENRGELLGQTSGLVPTAPTVEAIQDLVEDALVEMGRARVAKSYILYRDRRARARDALVVVDELTNATDADSAARKGRMPQVRDGGGTSPWNPGRIVAALVEEAQLPRELAEQVAERVESRVFDAGLRRLSTGLVREIVDNELGAMGLDAALRRQEPVGLPRHDLRRLLDAPRVPSQANADSHGGPAPGRAASAGAEVLERFALEDVLSSEVAERHRDGTLFVEDLGAPHLPLVRSVPAELLLRGEPTSHSAFDVLDELGPLLRESAIGVVLEDYGQLLVGRGVRNQNPHDALVALGAMGAAAGRRLDLSVPAGVGGRPGPLLTRLLPSMAELDAAGLSVPRIFLGASELEPALEAEPSLAATVERLLARGVLVPVWNCRERRWVAPGCQRRPRERVALACAGAVSINLPRLARRAGPWREDLLFEECASALRLAVEAFSCLERFQNERRGARGELLRERRTFAITPVGLPEALRILGDGEPRSDAGARLLGFLAEATRRFAEEAGHMAHLSSLFGSQARTRFAERDQNAPRATQARLFTGLPAPESELHPSYRSGYGLGDRFGTGPVGATLARLLSGVAAGALFPLASEVGGFGAGRGSSAQGSKPHLEAWQGFTRSLEQRSPVTGTTPSLPQAPSAAPLFDPRS